VTAKRAFPFKCRHCGFSSPRPEVGMHMICPVCGKPSQPKEIFRVYNNKFRVETAEELDPPIVVTDAKTGEQHEVPRRERAR